MKSAQPVLEWQNEGRVEAKRDALLRLLQLRYQDEVPEGLAATVQSMSEIETLNRWFDLAVTSASLQDFLRAVES